MEQTLIPRMRVPWLDTAPPLYESVIGTTRLLVERIAAIDYIVWSGSAQVP
jgi:hypothetical protein